MQVTASDTADQRTFVLVFDPGEEVVEVMTAFAEEHGIELGAFTAIGGFESVTLGFYNLETKGFDDIPFHDDQVEVLTLSGEITREDGKPRVHGHTVVGRRDGTTRGGHLLTGVVRPILIVNVEELQHEHPGPHH